MALVYYTDKGLQIEVEAEIGRGGEGSVYEINGRIEDCAKIYGPGVSTELRRKIELMVANPPRDPAYESPLKHRSLAWPNAVLYSDPGGSRFVGFVMPKINIRFFKKILSCFARQDRVRAFAPGYTWKHLCVTARNLASTVAAIHNRGYCVGDLNESNILVNAGALISVIDCDSVQVPDPATRRVYRCTVGKPEYTAPELQGKCYRDWDRTPDTDAFALGVLIFQLLMEGTHPYQAKGKLVLRRNS